jgi:hypothetical protein
MLLCAQNAAAGSPQPTVSDALRWNSSTRFGGTGAEVVWSGAVGPDDSFFLVGEIHSADFPTEHALQTKYAGRGDAFIMRIAPDRRSLLYSTYLGGSGADVAVGIAIGPTGEAYVVGLTNSSTFPRGAISHEQRGAGYDLFVVKIAPDGSQLDYTTVIGGQGGDSAEDIAIAGDGSVYVAGNTSSPDFPLTNPFQAVLGGSADGLVLRLDGESGEPLAASYLGGSGGDDIRAVAIAAGGTLYFAGNTDSTDLPKREGGQPSNAGGRLDIFVARVAQQAQALEATSYFGGSGEDHIGPGALRIDPTGFLLLAGSTTSADFPMVGALQPRFREGWFDAVVALIDPRSLELMFSTYLGGSDTDGAARAVSDGTRVYVTGNTASFDFPRRCARQPQHGAARYNAFLSVLETSPPRLVYSTYAGDVRGSDVLRTPAGEIIMVGDGLAAELPIVDPWPALRAGGGDSDGAVVTFEPAVSTCTGDCCADGRVSVDDLLTGVGIVLGNAPLADCDSLDRNSNGHVEVNELVTAVHGALGDCGAQ